MKFLLWHNWAKKNKLPSPDLEIANLFKESTYMGGLRDKECPNSQSSQMEILRLQISRFWPRAKLKGPKRSVAVVLVVGGESFWNEQNMFAMEQKMFLEQNHGIELPCIAVNGLVWLYHL